MEALLSFTHCSLDKRSICTQLKNTMRISRTGLHDVRGSSRELHCQDGNVSDSLEVHRLNVARHDVFFACSVFVPRHARASGCGALMHLGY